MRTLRLTEYLPSGGVRLSPQLRDAVARAIPGLSIAPVAGERDTYLLTPSSWIGVAALDGLTVQVQPKISIDRVLFLLGYSLHKRGWRLQPAALDANAGLLEAFVPIFCEVVRRAIDPGLLQGYRTEEEALQVVRGRIRFEDQTRNRFGLLPPVEVRYDEFTVDTPMNRVLRAAIDRLGKLTIRAQAARAELRRIASSFRAVSPVVFGSNALPKFTFDRLSARYQPAIELACLVLRATSVDLRAGAVATPGFFVDMNQVFEDFVVMALREDLGLSERTFPQNCSRHRLRLDLAGRVRLAPDLSWWEAGRCVFVGDAKYKRLSPAGFKNGDLYQMLAYCVAADLPGGLLVYAAGEGEAAVHEIVHAGKKIEVVHLDLAGSPRRVLAQVSALAQKVGSWRDARLNPAA